MTGSLRASAQGLALVDRARRRKGWTKTWTAAWWQTAHTSQATLRRFWRGLAIQRETFIAICQAVELSSWEAIADLTAIPELDLPLVATPHRLDGEEVIETVSLCPLPPATLPELPEGPVDLASAFYLERLPIESRCYKTIAQPGALIRVKAPRQMGKTSLVDRILAHARKQKFRTVRLNLLQAEGAKLLDLNHFLRWFCACVSQKLRLSAQLEDYWDQELGSIMNCTIYFQEHLLEQLDSPLVLALDEVDQVFQSPKVAQGFFSMLRSWYEEARINDLWEKLRLVVVHSTEDYGVLDINQSPFNVGLPIELTEFTPDQVSDLAQRHQLKWSRTQIQSLMAMVGGHPYLVRLALYHIACQDVTLEKLLQDAPTDAGIYEAHLRRHLKTLKENPTLGAALMHVVSTSEPVRLETLQAYQLYSMGLIKRQGDCVRSRCQLYQQYFRFVSIPNTATSTVDTIPRLRIGEVQGQI